MESMSLISSFFLNLLPIGILLLVSWSVHAGSIYKCKLVDGRIEYSDTACPRTAIDREYKGEDLIMNTHSLSRWASRK